MANKLGTWVKNHKVASGAIGCAGLLIIGFVILVIAAMVSVIASGPSDNSGTSEATLEAESQQPEVEEEETTPEAEETIAVTQPATPEPIVASSEEVVEAFDDYLSERAESGVMIAKAVTDISFDDESVKVIFDPAQTGVDEDLFFELSPFDNYAEFAVTPIAFANDEGKHLRTAVDKVETFLPDGNSLGSLTKEELYKQGTGEDLPENE